MDASRSPLELEILAEQAHTLARATGLLDTSLRALERARAAPPSEAADRRAASLLVEAQARLWDVIVQREAMGLTLHDILHEVLRVPAEVRVGAGRRFAGGGPVRG